jgi:hypothetical protein
MKTYDVTEAWKKREEEKKKAKNPSSNTNTNNTAYKKYDVTKAWEKRELEKTINFDTFSIDLENISKTVDSAYGGWQTPETMRNAKTSTQNMYNRIKAYQDYRQKYGSPDLPDLNELQSAYGNVLNDFGGLSETYGKYDSLDAYNNAVAESKRQTAEYEKMKTADLGVLQTEIDGLGGKLAIVEGYEKEIKEINSSLSNVRGDVRGNTAVQDALKRREELIAKRDAYLKEIGYGSVDELKNDVGGKKAYYNHTSWVQKGHVLASVGDPTSKNYDKDFESKSKYIAPEEKTGFRIESETKQKSAEDKYKFINDEDFRLSYAMFADDNASAGFLGVGYEYMTDEEKATYNYYYNTYGYEKADEYLNTISESLGGRWADDRFDTFKNNPVAEYLYGAGAGFDQFFSGLKNAFNYKDEYIPVNATQQLSGLIREDITRQHGRGGQVGYDLINTTSNMLPSILTSAVVSYVATPAVGANVGSVLMGLSAEGNAYQEMLNLGYDKGQARTYARLVGVSEAALERAIGGIGKLGGISGKLSKFVSGIDNGIARFAIRWGGSMAAEGFEEAAQEVLNPIFTNLAAGYDTGAEVDWSEVVYSGLLGALSGGILEGGDVAISASREQHINKTMGRNVKANERVADVFDIASNPEVASAYDTYTRYAKKGINADNISDVKLGRLYTEARAEAQAVLDSKTSTKEQRSAAEKIIEKLDVYAQHNVASRTGSAKGIKNSIYKDYDAEAIVTLIESGLESAEDTDSHRIATELKAKVENYDELAEIVNKKMNGEKLTADESKALADSKAKLSADEIANLSEANDRAIKAEESKDIATKLVEKGESEEIADIVARKLRGEEITEEEAQNLLKSENALSFIAESVNEENVSAEVIEKAKTMGKEEGALFVALYDGKTDVDAYANAFNLTVTKAEKNFGIKELLKHKSVLSNEQVGKIYSEVTIKTAHNKRIEFQRLSEKTANLKEYKGVIEDSVIDYNNTSAKGKVNWNALSPEKRQEVTLAKGLAQVTGMNLVFITDGKAQNINGSYSIDGNTITIDIFAEGRLTPNKLIDAFIPTMSHELTHWMENKSPVLFRKICDIVFTTLEKADGLSESERITIDIDKALAKEYKKKYEKENPGKTISPDKALKSIPDDVRKEAYNDKHRIEVARSEIVARACEDMLSRSKVGREMFNSLSKSEQKTLIDKIKDIIQNIKDWINNVLGLYESTSYEAQMLKRFDEELEKLSTLWDEMLTESVEVNQALEKSGAFEHDNVAEGVRNSIREEYVNEIEAWEKDGMPDGETFILGTTGDVLQGLGAIESDIYMLSKKINKILNDHPEMTIDEIKKIPQILENPILILKSQNIGRDDADNTRLVIFGNIKATDGRPILSVLDLKPVENNLAVNDMQKVSSAYTKDTDPIDFVKNSLVVYADKKRTTKLLRTIGFSAPIELQLSGYIGSIAYTGQKVNIKGEEFSKVFKEVNELNSDTDSTGRKLSEGQKDYFKDSVVRDENGSLKVMYRGDSSEFTVFDRKKTKHSNLYGRGFYFTDSKVHAEQYGEAREFYLDIKTPLSPKQNAITKKQMLNFLKAIENDGEDYDLYNYGQDATAESVLNSVWGKGDFEMLQDISASAIGDLVAAVELFNEVNGTKYDGIILPTETVTFNSEQAKLTSNLNPTKDKDIRFSMRENVEETRELVAVHNMQVSELERTLDLGGLPMPSIAIIKAKSGHSEYGDVSLVFPKSTIDPKANKNNKVYGGDAWTPVYPTIEYKPNDKIAKKISDKYYELSRKYGYDESRPLYNYVYDLERKLNSNKGEAELINELYDNTDLMNLYLLDTGKSKVETVKKETRTELTDAEVEMNEYFINSLGADVIDEFKWDGNGAPFDYRKKYMSKYDGVIRETYKKLLSEVYQFSDEQVQNVLDSTKPVDYLKFVRDAYNYRQEGRVTIKTEDDYAATRKAIKDAAGEDYRKWVDSLFRGVVEKSGIRNNKDYYTNSGNPRSWEALHWENNLENVVKVMKSQDNGVAALFSGHAIWAVSAKDYRSIEEMKADADRLQQLPEEEYNKIKEGFGERFQEIAHSIMSKTESNPFIASDNAMSCIVEAVRNSKTKSGLLKNLKEYTQLTVTETTVEDIISLVADISNMPTEYFEAKPQRAVELNEIATAIIPDKTSESTKARLDDMGIKYLEYESGNEQSRLDALNSLEDVRFSDRDDIGYHAGDLGKSEFLSQQGKDRDTGHFGTGTYFVGNKELIKDYNKRDGVPAPQHAVDFSNYNLYKVKNDKDGYNLHNQLHIIDGRIKAEWVEAAKNDDFSLYKSTEYYDIAEEKFGKENRYTDKALIYGLQELAKKANIEILTEKQFAKEGGYAPNDEWLEGSYLNNLKEEVGKKLDAINEEYAKFRTAYFDLKLRFGFKGQVYSAMKKVLEYQNANPIESRYAHKKDSLATVFMKALGYEGIDVRGTGLDNTAYGSVIYDLKEDTILFSDRDNTSVYDIMGETERIKKENEKFKAEIERLRERLKIERKVTHGNYFNENQLGAAAGHLRNISKSLIDKGQLVNSLKDVYTFIANSPVLTWEDIFERCYRVAEDMIAEAKPEKVVDDYSKQILRNIKSKRISFSEMQKQEASHIFGKNWNRNFFGRTTLTDDGIPVENQWREWASMYPDIFDADITDTDMPGELYDIINTLQDASETVAEYDTEEQTRWLAREIYNQYWNVSTIKTTADKYDKQIRLLNFEHRRIMTEFREEYNSRLKEQHKADKEKYKKLVADIRERKEKQIALAKEHGREMLSSYKENAERKTRMQSITSNALSLNDMLVKNSKDKHVPEIMREPVTALLQAIDFSSKRLLDKGIPTKKDISLSKALSKVKDMMVKATNAHNELVELYGHGLDEDIAKMVDSVDDIMRKVGDNEFILNKMTLEDLNTLDKTVKIIKYAVNKLNKFHTVNHARGIANLSQESVLHLDSLGKAKLYDGKRGAIKKALEWGNALPYYAFKRFGSGGMKVYEALQDGWDKFAFNTKKIIDYANEAYTSKDVKEWSEEVKTFKIRIPATEFELSSENYTPKYQEVQLTVPQTMSMYCLNKREQARGHLFQGGIRVADFKDKKGNIVSQSDGIIFTEADVRSILDSLTKEQKTVADKLQEFMNTVCTDWGNEVSMARFGYKAFGEENYFPIQSDKNNLAVNDETEQPNSLFKLLNMSFTKSTIENANNRIVISDIFDVFAQHTSDMAKYNALALPVLDAFKWYNYTEKESIAEGTFKTSGVKQSIEKAFGKDGQNYFTTFLKDINGQQEVSRDTLGKGFFSNAKIAAVGANLRVVLLQPTSYARASAVINNKYLAKALGHKPKIKKAETYCGIALWKSMGYYDTNIQRGVEAQIKHADTWKDKTTDLAMKGAEIADKITWGYLWNACELEIRDTRKDLKVGSKEFNEAIAKRLREVIYATQVVDSTMTRSQMMRSTDRLDKFLTAFSSEPTLSYNMLQDAYMEYSLDSRRMGKAEALKKNGKKIARILYAYTITNALAALVESGFDWLRDDDDEEMDMLTFMKLYLGNFASDMSITAKIPYIKEFHSMIKGFGSSRSDTQWMEEMTKAITTWYKIIATDKGKASTAIKYSIKALSDLSGIPVYNVYRDTMATLNKLDLFTKEDLDEMFGE